MTRDSRECQDCKKPAIFVHHIKSAYYNPELCFDPDNLIALCRECHLKRHGGIKVKKILELLGEGKRIKMHDKDYRIKFTSENNRPIGETRTELVLCLELENIKK